FLQSVSAGGMISPGHNDVASKGPAGVDDTPVIGGHSHGGRTAFAGLLPDVADHRLAGDVLQRLARQPGGGETGGYDDVEHCQLPSLSSASRARASVSSMTGMPSRTGYARPSARHHSSVLS